MEGCIPTILLIYVTGLEFHPYVEPDVWNIISISSIDFLFLDASEPLIV